MRILIKLFFLILGIYLAGSFLLSSYPEIGDSSDLKIAENFPGEDIVNQNSSSILITEEAEAPGKLSRTYSWDYKGYTWHLTLPFDDKLYEEYKSRTRNRDYDLFASDPSEDWLIKNIGDTLLSLAKENGLKESEIPELCVSFVQSLNYTSDLASSGYDQYPRFPYETLYVNGGDCEDTSILSVALLQEMGYDVVLLELPEHMAIGIKCDPEREGKSFEYNGSKFYYLETTGENWKIGEVPEEYTNQPVKVIPVYKRPFINLDFKAQCEYSSKEGVVDVNVTLRNVGSEVAKNTIVYAALQAPDKISVWDKAKSSPVTLKPEETYNYVAKGLVVPSGKNFRVYVQATGDNLISENITSEWVSV